MRSNYARKYHNIRAAMLTPMATSAAAAAATRGGQDELYNRKSVLHSGLKSRSSWVTRQKLQKNQKQKFNAAAAAAAAAAAGAHDACPRMSRMSAKLQGNSWSRRHTQQATR